MPRIISFCGNRPLEPRNGFIKAFEADEICADIVVGIAEFRIDLDSAFALGDGLVDFSLKVKRPSEKGVSLRGGMQSERSPIKLYRAVIVAFHLRLVCVLQLLPGLRLSIGGHADLLGTSFRTSARVGLPSARLRPSYPCKTRRSRVP